MNEAGSKSTPSLGIEGWPALVLTENHAATRTRVSLMAHACSGAKVAARAGGVPMNVMLKGKTKAVLEGLEVLGGVRMSRATPRRRSTTMPSTRT